MSQSAFPMDAPNAPKLTHAYKETQPDREKAVKADISRSRPISKASIEAQEKRLQKPQMKLEPKPPPGALAAAEEQELKARKQVAFEKARLAASSKLAKRSFNRSR